LVVRSKSRPLRGIGPAQNDAAGDCFDGTVVVPPPSIDRKPLFDGDDWPGGRGRDDAASPKKREGAIIIKKARMW
jgi:hypothetical protein